MSPEDQQELNEIRERAVWPWHTRTSGTDSRQAFEDRLVLLDWVDDLIQIQAGMREKIRIQDEEITTLKSVLDQYKASITMALSEMEDSFEACGEDFMAGTICSLAKGHSGEHGTICHKCGQDWYDQGHATDCPYFLSDLEDE
jgi:hypothetical protein